MKLYFIQPDGHGPTSYFVLANSPQDAAIAINEARRQYATNACGGYFQDDWGGDGAIQPADLSVAEVGQVLTNDND